MTSKIENQIADAKGWIAVLGVMFVFIGIGALVFPLLTTLTIEVFVGFTLVIAGIVTLFHALSAKEWSGFFTQLLVGMLYVIGGLFFLINPLAGAITLTVALGFIFFMEGVARSVMAFNIRPAENWGWVLASGCLSILIGLGVMAGLVNGASLVFVGILVGINFISAGISFVVIGMRRAPTEIIPAT